MIQRRKFLKIAGATTLASSTNLFANASASNADGIIVETASFKELGGWKVDPQFIEQMGAPYLMAHGMGKPVENAKTTIQVTDAGEFTLWARCKDWCPGDWDAPGQFQVKVNGQTIKTIFGTQEGWNWQKGLKVALKAGENTIELVDLTGFNGRSDALFFAKDPNFKPPNDLAELHKFRLALHKLKDAEAEQHKFDLVIAGAGIAGCGAALAAAEQGLKVALVSNRPVLGGNASSEIRVHTLGIQGKVSRILKKLDTKLWHNGSAKAYADDEKRHKHMNEAENVTIFYDYSVDTVNMDKVQITSLEARSNTSMKRIKLSAPQFIDCTGDGLVGFKAGARYRYGREDKKEFKEGWDKYGDLWSPEKKDNRVMGTTVMWKSGQSDKVVKFPATPWAKPVAKNYAEKKSEWYWEYSSNEKHQVDDSEAIRDHMLRAVYGNFSNLKTLPTNARLNLDWVAYIGGKRESRRIVGDYIYTMNDVTSHKEFADAVVMEEREIDAHYQRSEKGFPVDFISRAIFLKLKKHYFIPFRSLYSKDIPNLMMAGRCFSCSHIGLCGPRVMNTTGQMGVACGYAAALCIKNKTNPRGVYKNHITELRKLIGFE